MKTISMRLPDKIIEEIDQLVEQGLYASRTEALREGARILLRAQTGSIPGLPAEVTKDEIWMSLKEMRGLDKEHKEALLEAIRELNAEHRKEALE